MKKEVINKLESFLLKLKNNNDTFGSIYYEESTGFYYLYIDKENLDSTDLLDSVCEFESSFTSEFMTTGLIITWLNFEIEINGSCVKTTIPSKDSEIKSFFSGYLDAFSSITEQRLEDSDRILKLLKDFRSNFNKSISIELNKNQNFYYVSNLLSTNFEDQLNESVNQFTKEFNKELNIKIEAITRFSDISIDSIHFKTVENIEKKEFSHYYKSNIKNESDKSELIISAKSEQYPLAS